MKQQIAKLLKEAIEDSAKEQEVKIEITEQQLQNIIEIPPSLEMGDYAFPCFSLASSFKINPKDIALQVRAKLGELDTKEFNEILTAGPYINFYIDRTSEAITLIKEILKQKDKYGFLTQSKQKTMIEFVSPNTNKPLHIGHLRNMSIGESIARILEFNGEKVIRASLNNDRGIHICKSMAAYKLYGKNKKPAKNIKSDHFVGEYYALFGQREKTSDKLERESHKLLQKWEEDDKETIALWKKMNKWAFDGWKESYKKFGIKFDKEYYESKIYKKGRKIILDGLKKGVFKKNKEGAVFADLEKEKLGEKILLRSDGTSVYITQDIYLATLKYKEFKLNKSLYVTGNEQDYHFQVLFKLLEKLGIKHEGLKHVSYGMVTLPGGKIKSREGTKGISADEVVDKVQKLAKTELQKREKLSKKEAEIRSLKIALAAIKYWLLKTYVKKNITFNPKEALNFEGDTGPYILYSYARANSILKKATKLKNNSIKVKELETCELKLIKKLSQFNKVIISTYNSLNPALIANYSYQLAQTFNEFYHECPVIDSEYTAFRLKLVEAFKQVLKNSLYLLGIETLDKM